MVDAELVSLVKDFGFPVATCAYLLYDRLTITQRLISTIERNTDAINFLNGIKKI